MWYAYREEGITKGRLRFGLFAEVVTAPFCLICFQLMFYPAFSYIYRLIL